MTLSCQTFIICCAVQPGKGKSVEGVTLPLSCLTSLTCCCWENGDNMAFLHTESKYFPGYSGLGLVYHCTFPCRFLGV